MDQTEQRPHLSVVIPCYNEQEVLPLLRQRLVAALDALAIPWDVVFVDDGSKDTTRAQLREIHREDPRFKVIGFTRNFGHQPAVTAGISYAEGDIVAVMDADLQDPPELLEQCLALWREGYSIVYAIRQKRKESLVKRMCYALFYRLLQSVADIDIPLDSGDFCLMDRCVVNVLKNMPERNIFMRGLRAWSGFRQIGITYERDSRAAGETKYPLRKLIKLGLDGIFSFSTLPLRLTTWLGLGTVLMCICVIFSVLVWRLGHFRFMGHTADQLPGWSAAAVGLLFLSGVQMLMLGFIGEYLARVYDEVKGRPRWIVNTTLGFHSQPGREERTTHFMEIST